jgi:hypothetical protein
MRRPSLVSQDALLPSTPIGGETQRREKSALVTHIAIRAMEQCRQLRSRRAMHPVANGDGSVYVETSAEIDTCPSLGFSQVSMLWRWPLALGS